MAELLHKPNQRLEKRQCMSKSRVFCCDPTMLGHFEVHSDFLAQLSFTIRMNVNLKLEVDFSSFANSSEHDFITSNRIHTLSIPITTLVIFDRNSERHLTSKFEIVIKALYLESYYNFRSFNCLCTYSW